MAAAGRVRSSPHGRCARARIDVGEPGAARIGPQPVSRAIGEQFEGAFDVARREGHAIVLSHAAAQGEGQFGVFIVPRPGLREIGGRSTRPSSAAIAGLNMTRLLKIGMKATTVAALASSRIEAVAGLSRWKRRSVPPLRWASAASPSTGAGQGSRSAISYASPDPYAYRSQRSQACLNLKGSRASGTSIRHTRHGGRLTERCRRRNDTRNTIARRAAWNGSEADLKYTVRALPPPRGVQGHEAFTSRWPCRSEPGSGPARPSRHSRRCWCSRASRRPRC